MPTEDIDAKLEEFKALPPDKQADFLDEMMDDIIQSLKDHAPEARDLSIKISDAIGEAGVPASVMACLSVAIILARKTGLGDIGLLRTLEMIQVMTSSDEPARVPS